MFPAREKHPEAQQLYWRRETVNERGAGIRSFVEKFVDGMLEEKPSTNGGAEVVAALCVVGQTGDPLGASIRGFLDLRASLAAPGRLVVDELFWANPLPFSLLAHSHCWLMSLATPAWSGMAPVSAKVSLTKPLLVTEAWML